MVVHGDAAVTNATVEGARRLEDVAGGALLANNLLLLFLAGCSLITAQSGTLLHLDAAYAAVVG